NGDGPVAKRRTMNVAWVALVLVSVSHAPASCCQDRSEAPPYPPLDRIQVLKDWGALHRRVNGVLLTVSACINGEKDTAKIEIDWTLAYNGPRPPLIIIRPSVTDLNDCTTVVWVFAKGTNSKFYRLGFSSPVFEGINPLLDADD